MIPSCEDSTGDGGNNLEICPLLGEVFFLGVERPEEQSGDSGRLGLGKPETFPDLSAVCVDHFHS